MLAHERPDRLGQEALATAKKVRNQTEIGKKTVSIASAAAELVASVFSDIGKHSLMIIGAGEMARIVAKHLIRRPPKELAIVNRSAERANHLIHELGSGDYVPLTELSAHIPRFDIIVTATNASDFVITAQQFGQARHQSRLSSVMMVDISLPRNIDPDIAAFDDVFLFDIDDLKQVVQTNKDARSKEADKAEDIINEAVDRFRKWYASQQLKPLMTRSQNFYDALVRSSFEKTESKRFFKELPEETRQEFEKLKENESK